jgi:winged helix DNA-binding protein
VTLKLTWDQAAAWRVRQHHLDRRARPGRMLAVASRLCGVQAQLMSSAELALWARVDDLARREVRRALWDERTLVKTWAMRGTLHLLPSKELPFWSSALSMNRAWLKEHLWKKYYGITLDELARITDAIGQALHGGPMTREELGREVGRRMGARKYGAKLVQSSWGTMLRPAAFSGRLCFAPSVGARVRFANPQTWLTSSSPRSHTAMQPAEIARRFLTAYGPATYHDLARWWTGGGVATAREWIDALGDDVVAVDVEGLRAWMLASDARRIRQLAPLRSVRLVPAFDQYVIGASWHAAHLLPGDLRARVYRPQGWISPVLLVNGRMLGTWKHTVNGRRVDVTIEPFVSVPRWVRPAAAEEAERLAQFLGGNLSLRWES